MQKPPEITFKDIERSDALEALIRDKIEHLERFHSRIIGCRVVVSVPHRSPAQARPVLAVAVEVEVPGSRTITVKDRERPDEPGGERGALVNKVFQAVQRRLQTTAETLRKEVKRHESAPDTGQITRLFADQGYGFVEVEGSSELYFTSNAVVDDRFGELKPGMLVHVTRATLDGQMGPQASSVRLLDASRTPQSR